MQMIRISLTMMLCSMLLAACASGPSQDVPLAEKLAAKGYVIDQQVGSIRDWSLNGWTYVDDQHFIMHSGVRDRYLVTLRSSSFELRGAINLAFSTTVGSLTDKDRVILRGAGDFRETILIDTLHSLKRIERDAAPE
jgi:hypothetical protein